MAEKDVNPLKGLWCVCSLHTVTDFLTNGQRHKLSGFLQTPHLSKQRLAPDRNRRRSPEIKPPAGI